MTSNVRIVGESSTGKNFGGSGRGLRAAVSWHLLGCIDRNCDNFNVTYILTEI
jgi:hypothetical protein